MGMSLLFEPATPFGIHRGIKPSRMIVTSFFLHALFFLLLFFMTPRTLPPTLLLQNYQVSLVSPKLFEPKEKPLAPAPLPVFPPKTVPPPVKKAEVSMEMGKPVVQEKVKSPPKAPVAIAPSPPVPDIVTATKIPSPLPLPSSAKEEKPAAPLPAPAASETASAPGEEGVTAAISPSGARGGAAGSSSSFGYPYYLRNIEHKIGTQWMPPPASSVAQKKERVVAVIGFVIKQDGKIDTKSVTVEKSSGNSFFDMAALRAIHNANPLPPLPTGILDDLRVHFSFAVSLDS